MSNILLVYEEIPERTIILLLNPTDLEAAKISPSEIASIHATYVNSTDMNEERHVIHIRVSEAIFGEYGEEVGDHGPAIWKDRIIFRTDDEALCRAGLPPKIGGDPGFVVIHTGFVL